MVREGRILPAMPSAPEAVYKGGFDVGPEALPIDLDVFFMWP